MSDLAKLKADLLDAQNGARIFIEEFDRLAAERDAWAAEQEALQRTLEGWQELIKSINARLAELSQADAESVAEEWTQNPDWWRG